MRTVDPNPTVPIRDPGTTSLPSRPEAQAAPHRAPSRPRGAHSGFVPLALLGLLGACGGSNPITEGVAAPVGPVTTEQSQLLLFPVADGESLLGRALEPGPTGGYVIAAERAPGCDVRVTRQPAEYAVKRRVKMGDASRMAIGVASVVSISTKLRNEDLLEVDLENAEILTGDATPECGPLVVGTVFVGKGRRNVLRAREVGAELSGTVAEVTPSVGHESSAELVDTIEWHEAQAYGFSPLSRAVEQALGLVIEPPSAIVEGDPIEIRFRTTRLAWLVVYYLEEAGPGQLLWPSPELPEPQATPELPALLPSAAERAKGIEIKAALRKPGEPARETIVAYAFTEKADFDRFKPAIGSSSDDGAALEQELRARIEQLPARRWTRAEVHYVITPKAK